MDAADEVPFSSFLETGTSDVVRTGGARRSDSLTLGGTVFGTERAISYARVVMVFRRMHLATNVTSLGVKPSLPGRVRRANRRR